MNACSGEFRANLFVPATSASSSPPTPSAWSSSHCDRRYRLHHLHHHLHHLRPIQTPWSQDLETLFRLRIEKKTKRFMIFDPKKKGGHFLTPPPTSLETSKKWVSNGGGPSTSSSTSSSTSVPSSSSTLSRAAAAAASLPGGSGATSGTDLQMLRARTRYTFGLGDAAEGHNQHRSTVGICGKRPQSRGCAESRFRGIKGQTRTDVPGSPQRTDRATQRLPQCGFALSGRNRNKSIARVGAFSKKKRHSERNTHMRARTHTRAHTRARGRRKATRCCLKQKQGQALVARRISSRVHTNTHTDTPMGKSGARHHSRRVQNTRYKRLLANFPKIGSEKAHFSQGLPQLRAPAPAPSIG